MPTGFTLLEVMVAIAILATSLLVLLEAQVSSLNNAGRSRGLTVAALLARGKMIDIEQKLADEGFTMGDTEDSGDFSDESHPEIKWKYKVSEVELDISSMGDMCEEDDMSCSGLMSGVGGAFEGFLSELGKSVRAVDLTVTWPDGKYSESMSVRALLTREDLATTGGTPGGGPLSGGDSGGASGGSGAGGPSGTGGTGGAGTGGDNSAAERMRRMGTGFVGGKR